MNKRQTPLPDLLCPEVQSDSGVNEAGSHARLDRYATARARALSIADHLASVGALDSSQRPLADQLRACGSWLVLRHYYLVDRTRLQAMHSCDRSLLCPLCAIRRSARLVRRYDARIRALSGAKPQLSQWLITFTVINQDDLRTVWQQLRGCLQAYHEQRKQALRGRRAWVEPCRAVGAVWSYEVKRGRNSGLWHPHCHALWLCESAPNRQQLISEWRTLNASRYGDRETWDVHVRRCNGIDGLLEVFKYSLKFTSMSDDDLWHAYQQLQGCRLIGSFGDFRGLKIDGIAEPELDDEPYIDMLYRWYDKRYGCVGRAIDYEFARDGITNRFLPAQPIKKNICD